jgi:hypothetical protein
MQNLPHFFRVQPREQLIPALLLSPYRRAEINLELNVPNRAHSFMFFET